MDVCLQLQLHKNVFFLLLFLLFFFLFFIFETQTNGVCKFSLNEEDLLGGGKKSLRCGNSGHPANLPGKPKDDHFIFCPSVEYFNGRTCPFSFPTSFISIYVISIYLADLLILV